MYKIDSSNDTEIFDYGIVEHIDDKDTYSVLYQVSKYKFCNPHQA